MEMMVHWLMSPWICGATAPSFSPRVTNRLLFGIVEQRSLIRATTRLSRLEKEGGNLNHKHFLSKISSWPSPCTPPVRPPPGLLASALDVLLAASCSESRPLRMVHPSIAHSAWLSSAAVPVVLVAQRPWPRVVWRPSCSNARWTTARYEAVSLMTHSRVAWSSGVLVLCPGSR